MKQTDLLSYLQNKISAFDLLKKYEDDIESYKMNMLRKGGSININFEFSKDKLIVNKDVIRKLYNDFINDKLDFYLMSYISDIFTLYDNVDFENEDIRESVEIITDYENEKISKDIFVKRLLNI